MNSSSEIRYRWRLLRAGPIRLDGGGMFGLIPRVVWTKTITPDELGRVELSHNCLLLEPAAKTESSTGKIVIESGSGNKLDAKSRGIFGLTDRWLGDALMEAGCDPATVEHAIVTHLHFDHAGGLTRLAKEGESADWTGRDAMRVKLTFPNAMIHAQKREWEDALINRSVMTRTYLAENLHPLRDQLKLWKSPAPFPSGHIPRRDEEPATKLAERETEILPGIFVFLTPGHTWAQQVVRFTDESGRLVVFTPDVMPTSHHVGAAYNLAYDVEPFISTVTRRWFLRAAAENDWLLVLNHEPENAAWRVCEDGKGWWKLVE